MPPRSRSVLRGTLSAALLLWCVIPRTGSAAERDAVVRIGGCTGFIVDGQFLVTAKHCRHPQSVSVQVNGRTTMARKRYEPSGDDGPVVFELDGGPYPSLPVAARRPEAGEPVYSLGYPGGNWARVEGKLIGRGKGDVNLTNHRIETGNSGGPLLNAQGEVIGVALFVASDLHVHQSGFAGWQVTADAVQQAQVRAGRRSDSSRKNDNKIQAPPEDGVPRPLVVVFSSQHCPPCRQLERDVEQGHFEGYDFRFVRYDDRSGIWSDPALYREFCEACRPEADTLAFPTIWVRGTDQYRTGYEIERRGGLLGWLAGAVRHVLEGLVGRDEPPRFPAPALPPGREGLPEADDDPRSLIGRLVTDIQALKDQAAQAKTDFEEFQEAGVLGKIRAIARLRTDKDEALASVDAVKADVAAIRSRFRERPLTFLWGLFGLVSGLIHRRFAA